MKIRKGRTYKRFNVKHFRIIELLFGTNSQTDQKGAKSIFSNLLREDCRDPASLQRLASSLVTYLTPYQEDMSSDNLQDRSWQAN
jgi:hypothetical protein